MTIKIFIVKINGQKAGKHFRSSVLNAFKGHLHTALKSIQGIPHANIESALVSCGGIFQINTADRMLTNKCGPPLFLLERKYS